MKPAARHYLATIVACVVLNWVTPSFGDNGARRPGWLSARDFGASGSTFQTTAATTASSRQITARDPGDFKVGQGVTISKCNPQFVDRYLTPPTGLRQPLDDAAELRGYNGSAGSWLVYIVEINGTDPLTFRFSDDMTRTWKAARVPVTFDWQPLSNGIQIKFRRRDLQPGHLVTFSARDQLATKIEKIDGHVLTLAASAARTVADAVVRHCDTDALQTAVRQAIKGDRDLFLPPGHYRIYKSLEVADAKSIHIAGAGAADTVLDISDGEGACIRLNGGKEVVVRDLSMVGHTGLGEGPGWHSFSTSSGRPFWPKFLKQCHAVIIHNTERVLIEDCHASRMNGEAFYCQGSSRTSRDEPKHYTKQLTFLRCWATNCDGNAFNNNDQAENTSVLHCRIVDVGGCSWEGASRFVRLHEQLRPQRGPGGDGQHRQPRRRPGGVRLRPAHHCRQRLRAAAPSTTGARPVHGSRRRRRKPSDRPGQSVCELQFFVREH